ncbi:MAG TPA: hypothetical protein VIT83_01360, partial [Gammaproteobacteria bacterium]
MDQGAVRRGLHELEVLVTSGFRMARLTSLCLRFTARSPFFAPRETQITLSAGRGNCTQGLAIQLAPVDLEVGDTVFR